MAVPEQIKEITVTTVDVPEDDFDNIGLAADPDRIFLRLHNRTSKEFFYLIGSTAVSGHEDMVKVIATDRMVEFSTHVPTETVYLSAGVADSKVTIEHASRNSTT
jgi:hypothetical protein